MRKQYQILALWANFFGIFILLVPMLVITPGVMGGVTAIGQSGPTVVVERTPVPVGSSWNSVTDVPQRIIPPTSRQAEAEPAAASVSISIDKIARSEELLAGRASSPAKPTSASRINLRSNGLKTMAAPDFTLTTLEGKKISLSSLKGKNVMLNFWATWCGPCASEIPYIQSFYDKVSDQDLVVLTVNYKESEDIVREYASGENISVPVLLDPDGEACRKYNVLSIPRTYFIDSEGYVQMVKFGSFETTEEIEYYFK